MTVQYSCRACERSRAARIYAPRLRGCSLLKVIPDSSAQILLSAHLKFHSALVNSLHAPSNLKEGAIPDVASVWPVCLLFEIYYKLHLSTNYLLEGIHESVWTCACPRLVESGIGTELERNGTIALAFGLKPVPRSNYISHAPLLARAALRSALGSAHMPCTADNAIAMLFRKQSYTTLFFLGFTSNRPIQSF